MKTIKEIIKQVNSYELPIKIMDNESLSIPFIAEMDDKLYLAFFVYHMQGAYGDRDKKVMVRCVYYINPDDIDDIRVRKVENSCNAIPDIDLFSRENISEEMVDAANRYDFLVDLTDDILKDSNDKKEKANLYADYFCADVNDQLKAFYWKYGKKYFKWLNSLL